MFRENVNIFIYCFILFSLCRDIIGEIILTEDRPYDIIDIKVPINIYNRAILPTPILKSAATITLPIHVNTNNEYQDEDENDVLHEEELTVSNPEETSVQNEPVTQVAAVPSTASTLTQADDTSNITQDQVQGQVSRFPCTCEGGQCGCCTGMILQRLNMNACGNIRFVPEDFVFDVRLSVNDNTVVRRRVSASDPPPICFNPRRAPFVRVCVEISNIRIRNRNAFACLDITADIAGFQVYNANFRCFGLGSSGVQTGLKPKPVSQGPKPVNLFGATTQENVVQNAAGAILSGDGAGGLLDGVVPDNLFGDDDGGPLDAIGDAVGGLFGGGGE